MLLSKWTGLSPWHKVVKADDSVLWDDPLFVWVRFVSFIPSSHLCQHGADPSPLRPPPPPYLLSELPEGHCLDCVEFLYFLHASPVPLSPQHPLDLPSPRWSPSSSRPLPSLLNSLLTLPRGPCSLSVWSQQELESFLSWTNVILTLPVFRASLWRVTSHGKMATIFIHDLGPRYKLMLSAPSDSPSACVRIFLGLFFLPLSFSFYPME